MEWRLDSIFVNALKAVRFWFWHEAVDDGHELMAVDCIHYRLPCGEMAVLGNLSTFFYFGITLLPPKKKSCKLHVLFQKKKREIDCDSLLQRSKGSGTCLQCVRRQEFKGRRILAWSRLQADSREHSFHFGGKQSGWKAEIRHYSTSRIPRTPKLLWKECFKQNF